MSGALPRAIARPEEERVVIADRVCAIDPEIAVGAVGSGTRFIPHAGTPDEILSRLGVDPARVAETAKELGRGFLD